MRQNIFKMILMLLAVLLPTAWVSAHNIVMATMQNGTVTASHTTAEAGETVTLTVKPNTDYLLDTKTLKVEAVTDEDSDMGTVTGHRAPSIGIFATLTKTGDNTYTFEMPDFDVIVSASFFEQGPFDVEPEDPTGSAENIVILMIEPDYEKGTATINLGRQTGSEHAIVSIPATVEDRAGNEFVVTTVAGYAFFGMTNVTDIYLPETDEPLTIEEGAFLLDNETGSNHRIPAIHTPLALLDDYALMTQLSENYRAAKMMATVEAENRYRTFSCGVDVQMPASVQIFTVYMNGGEICFNQLGTGIIVKANNGVLLSGATNGGYAFDVAAVPSNDRPSGMEPPTDNAESYANNMLVPLVAGRHLFSAQNYYVLHNNQFYPVMREELDVMCPPCKAALRIPRASTATAK